MWAAMQAAIAAVTPYQGNDPVASASYRAAVGQAMCTAIISEQNSPVAWDGTNDRVLDVGQFTSDSFSAQTSMPLHIACGDGQIYEIDILGNSAWVAAAANSILQPNNTVPTTNSFTLSQLLVDHTGAVSGTTLSAAADGGFRLDGGGAPILFSKCTIFTTTGGKRVLSDSTSATSTANYFSKSLISSWWDEQTTNLSSLGTIILPSAWTGQIVCRRIA